MAFASFTVYCDTPADAADNTTDIRPPPAKVLSSSSIDSNLPTSSSSTSVSSLAEKENFHPVTGERCGAPVGTSAGKKRKTNVLSTKPIVTKKQKEDKAEGKKPRSASSSKGRKDTKSGKKGVKKPSRRVSPLPKVDEDDAEKDRVMQADVDSRCYELTVSPLADVTQAYDAGFDVNSLLTSFTPEESAKFRKATSTEPEIRDYFSPTHCSGRVTPPASAAGTSTKVFNTPERRHIYSAFTFTTPSPSSERFRKANSRSPSPTIPPLNLSPTATTSTTTV